MKQKTNPDRENGPEEGVEPETRSPAEAEHTPEEECVVLMDRLRRLQAEYENYRRRVGREQTEWRSRAVESLVLDLLPVLDSFGRAIDSVGEAPAAADVLEGMILVHKQLLGALRNHGVEPMESLGQPFDPEFHEAFASRPAEPGEAPGTLVEEIVPGYRMGDRTIRPAKGIVAAAAPEEEEEVSDSEATEN